MWLGVAYSDVVWLCCPGRVGGVWVCCGGLLVGVGCGFETRGNLCAQQCDMVGMTLPALGGSFAGMA